MASQTEVVETSTQEVEIYSPALLAMCREQDPDQVLRRFARRFDQAATLDELFDVLQGTNSQMLVGQELEIRHVEWAPYESDRGTIPLAIVQAAKLADGELVEFATTGGMMCLFLYKWQLLKLAPFQTKIVGVKTRSGQTALNFERIS